MDDRRIGSVIRVLRRRKGWRQSDLAAAAGVHQSDVSNLERGHVADYRVTIIRAVLGALDGRCDLEPRWRGAAIDRLLDDRHATLAGQGGAFLGTLCWEVLGEVTYSEYGERGSIDLFSARPDVAAALVGEVKSEFVSLEATLRSVDVKARLAPKLCRDRFGFQPLIVAQFLILPESTTTRRQLTRHAALLGRSFPLRGWAARRWLARPVAIPGQRSIGGVLLLPDIGGRDGRRAPGGPSRVRAPLSSPDIAVGDTTCEVVAADRERR